MKRAFLLLAVLLSITISIWVVSATPLFLRSMYASKPVARTLYTIRYFDRAGHVVKVWQGSKTEAERIKQRERTIRRNLMPLQQQGVIPHINRVLNCPQPNDFFDLYNQGVVCFANAGSVSIRVYSVYEIDSGNNSGAYDFNTGNGSLTRSIAYFTTDYFVQVVTVTHITIVP